MGYVRDRWKDPDRKGKGRRWQVKYQVDGREKDGGSFDNREVAKRKLTELESALHRGQWVDPTDQTTVTELVRADAATRIHRPATAARVERMIVNHVESTPLGARRATAVRPSEIQAWVSGRAQVLAPSTLRTLVTMVRAAFTAAVMDRRVGASPFQRIVLPRIESERVVPLSVHQVRALAETIGPRYSGMVLAQAGLGLRLGELLALRAEDVDFLRRTVRITDQIDRRTRERVPPKTPRSRRTLPLPDMVSLALAAHMRDYPPAASGLLFHTADGLPYLHGWYASTVFRRGVARAGLPAGTIPHDCRHHFASVLLAAGQSVVAVAELLGHQNATLVLTTYGHLLPGAEDLARMAIEAAWVLPAEAATALGRPG